MKAKSHQSAAATASLAACGLIALVSGAAPAGAADVSFERLVTPEPQNWLMNHHDYAAQRYSALDVINKTERQEPAARLRGRARRHLRQREPEGDAAGRDGFMYVPDAWGVVYKIDVRSGDARRHRLEDGPRPGEDRPQSRRRAVGQSRHLGDEQRRPRDRDRQGHRQDRCGRATCATSRTSRSTPRRSRSRTRSSSAPRAATAARATGSPRSMPRPANLLVEDLFDPGARRARQRDLEGQQQCLADRRRRLLGHRLLRSRHQSQPIGAPAIRCRNTIHPTGPATISTPTARSRSMPPPAA